MYQNPYLRGKKQKKLGYIGRKIDTNEVFYSKGATKIAKKVGCSASTITKHYSNKCNKNTDKEIKGWIVSKVVEIENKNRGIQPKSVFNGRYTEGF